MNLTVVVLGLLLAVARADLSSSVVKSDFTGARIVGGHDAKIGQFPYIVLVLCTSPERWSSFCGGSIIHPRWVLTAAHCVKYYEQNCPKDSQLHIAAGKHTNTGVSEANEQLVKVSKSIVHEKYQPAGKISADDIVLLKLERPLMLNQFVKPISLAPAYHEPYRGKAVAAGWGRNTYEGTTSPEVLQTVDMEIVDLKTCNASVSQLDPPSAAVLQVTNMCTGPLTGGVSTCPGDSGGPVVVNDGGREVLAGVISWGFSPCGIVNAPSVQAQVSDYVFWIMNKMITN